ncbi:MAG: DUF362 domain-containing protein [Desulfobacterales bacterium]|jgi:hypothetical protein
MKLPNMYRIRQRFDDTRVEDIRETVKAELGGLSWSAIRPGDRVAITAGSRGIADIAQILGATVEFFKSLEADPFLFPAMGSHGGATAEGQVAMLAQLGVTEASVNAPILSSMETEEIGSTEDNVPVFVDKNALAADHIVVVNRIKSHTKFKAPIESGLMKMMAIGMGKLKGSELYHSAAVQYTFFKIIADAARVVLTKVPVVCAVGILENAYGQTAKISVLKAAEIESREKDLLNLSKKMMAKLPFNEIDLLIVDEMGKDISGVGIDPNITGRNRDLLGVFPHPVQVKRLFVRDLTDRSKGNATGIGLADVTTQRLVDKIDYAATYKNCITGVSPEKAAVPMHFGTDRDAIDVALGCIGLIPSVNSKIVRIKNTLRLDILEVSEAYAETFQISPDLEIIAGPNRMEFNSENNLL